MSQQVNNFEFNPTTRVIFGKNSIEQLETHIMQLGGKHILMITDSGIVKAGIIDRIFKNMKNSLSKLELFQDVQTNPTTEDVERGVTMANQTGNVDLLVAVGGGSAMDCAKGINFLLSNGGKMEDYWGKNKAAKPMLPSIGIPTTAGSGSEAQSFALIAQKNTHKKMACGDHKARFRTVIIDPLLYQSVPKYTAALTGIDAMSHALESYVSTASNAFSRMFAREAWHLLNNNLDTVLNDTKNTTAWSHMALGAHFAGFSIEHSMLGAAHALANPLTAKYNIAHGLAVGVMLPYVIEFNMAKSALYENLTENGTVFTGEYIISRIQNFVQCTNAPSRLREFGIKPSDLENLAYEAGQNWTGKFNPRPVTAQDYLRLYQKAF